VYDVTVEHNVGATMRDGTVLRADVYRPTAAGPWPVLLTRLPYGKHLPGLIRRALGRGAALLERRRRDVRGELLRQHTVDGRIVETA